MDVWFWWSVMNHSTLQGDVSATQILYPPNSEGRKPSTLPWCERDFQARLMSVHLAPIPLALCYCLGFNNNGVAFKSLRLTALSDNHKRICVRLETSLSAKLLIAPGGWSYYD